MGFQRTLEETISLSSQITGLSGHPQGNLLYGKINQLASPTSPFPREQILFPGLIPAMLAFRGLQVSVLNRNCISTLVASIFSSHYLVLLLIAGLLSLGHSFLFQRKECRFPTFGCITLSQAFQSMRVPARFCHAGVFCDDNTHAAPRNDADINTLSATTPLVSPAHIEAGCLDRICWEFHSSGNIPLPKPPFYPGTPSAVACSGLSLAGAAIR